MSLIRRSLEGPWVPAVLLLLLALLVRALFVSATPDADGPFSPYYKGDAALWFEAVLGARSGEPFELGLPLRPPATRWLVDLAWGGDPGPGGFTAVRLLWIVLGAAWAPLAYWALLPASRAAAVGAGLLSAVATSAILVSASPNSEAPYLCLAILSAGWALRVRPTARWSLLGFGALQGFACLFRVEHLLAALLMSGWIAWRLEPRVLRRKLVGAGLLVAGLLVVTAPTCLVAHRRLVEFNAMEVPPAPARSLDWDPAAVAELQALPGFSRQSAQLFVEATIRYRGGARVEPGDLQRLHEDAFGSVPERMSTWPFVAAYGPLNFALAHAPEGDAGFSRAALDRPIPLEGGASAWDPAWLASLPSGAQLAFGYPPHLDLVNHGYRRGLGWILDDPGRFVGRSVERLRIAAAGTAPRLGGMGVPVGAAGVRRPVDLTVPEPAVGTSLLAAAALLAALVGWGRWLRDARVLVPWAALGVTLLVAVVAFFGYARQGVLLTPAVGAGLGALLGGLARGRKWGPVLTWFVLGVALTVATVEIVRFAAAPTLFLDGEPVGEVEPFDLLQWQTRQLEAR